MKQRAITPCVRPGEAEHHVAGKRRGGALPRSPRAPFLFPFCQERFP